ncbi:cysteine--tRNA ligase [candidate division WOR-1 bacterium RIFOXYB2_FULL_48_7]|uniref:Cysteine--tRNA ligase n=1 Tax=candidate division WOR-1 bacterium RIFOXYB2_FULL_48_7 TaxID=1802583 RepID=A0A1F4T856_UNCSA|nr:MAG: cysteine--tRNA ligase [candidate division WOR-1 bacterium RIFOXYB2_FULL_48_7]
MTLRIYNTLTRKKEDFVPLAPPAVNMYVCGITPYDESHVGHGRAYVVFDTIRRYLEYCGFRVKYVQNVTDVDDKIINKSRELGIDSSVLATKFTQSFLDEMDKLNVKRADIYPKATEHIPEMIRWISGLVERGIAYQLADGVYFSVEKFPGYGQLSHRKPADNEAGARVGVDSAKKNPFDFALWKTAKAGEPSWESPWGLGRPGWHIECSAMSTKYLGEQFDIHGGGMDLEFPHHENELAQTEALTGKRPWVKYWLHNGFVTINKQKMSKSLGNFFTLKDIFSKFDPMVVRFFFLLTHYRSPINYSDSEIIAAGEGLNKIKQFISEIEFLIEHSTHEAPPLEVADMEEELTAFRDKFRAAMDDDFNTAGALAAIFELMKYCRQALAEGEREAGCLRLMRDVVVELTSVLGINLGSGKSQVVSGELIEELIDRRMSAKKDKDYKKADEIRQQLLQMGIIIEDTPQGTRWKTQT